jgi:hypothetical protein
MGWHDVRLRPKSLASYCFHDPMPASADRGLQRGKPCLARGIGVDGAQPRRDGKAPRLLDLDSGQVIGQRKNARPDVRLGVV